MLPKYKLKCSQWKKFVNLYIQNKTKANKSKLSSWISK